MSLKDLTKEKHKEAENSTFNVRMMKGNLTASEYVRYLVQQKEIFKKLEEVELPHSEMNRLNNIDSDITELSSRHDTHIVLDSTQQYILHLDSLSVEERLPHVYLNYMALLFGGQMFKKIVPGSGLFYSFDNPQEIIQSIREIQQDEWADEVSRGFDFIKGIFDELQQVSEQSSEPF
jgi:heme oxygenase